MRAVDDGLAENGWLDYVVAALLPRHALSDIGDVGGAVVVHQLACRVDQQYINVRDRRLLILQQLPGQPLGREQLADFARALAVARHQHHLQLRILRLQRDKGIRHQLLLPWMGAAHDKSQARPLAERLVQHGGDIGCSDVRHLVELHRVADMDAVAASRHALHALRVLLRLHADGAEARKDGLEDAAPLGIALAGLVGHASVDQADFDAALGCLADEVRPDFNLEDDERVGCNHLQGRAHSPPEVNGAVESRDTLQLLLADGVERGGGGAGKDDIVLGMRLLPRADERHRRHRFTHADSMYPYLVLQGREPLARLAVKEAEALPVLLRQAATLEYVHKVERQIEEKQNGKQQVV